MKNIPLIQGLVAIAAMICLAIGWFNLLSPELNDLFYNKFFYILIGISFILAAFAYTNPYLKYVAYAAAAMCIIGPFLPENLQIVKTIGLISGVVLSFTNRPSRTRPQR